MGSVLTRRTDVGERFSEGARRLWVVMVRRKWTQGELTRQLGCPRGLVNRWIYGMRVPSTRWAAEVERITGIKSNLWAAPPSKDFEIPARTGKAA